LQKISFLLCLSILVVGCGSDNYDGLKKDKQRDSQSITNTPSSNSATSKSSDKKESAKKHQEQKPKKKIYKKPSRNIYISVGDSTRASFGQYVYKVVSSRLTELGYKTKLMAKHGYKLSQFAYGEGYPDVYDVINSINGDGSKTIVNISLGINDYHTSGYEIKELLESAIRKIKDAKPNTLIVLTTPNRLLYNSDHTHDIDVAYSEVSSEFGLKLIWAGHDLSSNYYRADGVHPNESGQKRIANEVLSGLSLGRSDSNDEDWHQWENDSDEDWHQWDD